MHIHNYITICLLKWSMYHGSKGERSTQNLLGAKFLERGSVSVNARMIGGCSPVDSYRRGAICRKGQSGRENYFGVSERMD